MFIFLTFSINFWPLRMFEIRGIFRRIPELAEASILGQGSYGVVPG